MRTKVKDANYCCVRLKLVISHRQAVDEKKRRYTTDRTREGKKEERSEVWVGGDPWDFERFPDRFSPTDYVRVTAHLGF